MALRNAAGVACAGALAVLGSGFSCSGYRIVGTYLRGGRRASNAVAVGPRVVIEDYVSRRETP